MKESKAVYVTKRNIKDNLSRDYNFYVSHVIRDRDLTLQSLRYEKTQEVGTQYDCKRDNLICTCRNLSGVRKRQNFRYLTAPHQVFAYHEKSRSFTDIGIGTVQPFQRKKVKRIYLPETNDRGCGSSDLSNYLLRKPRQYVPRGYYETKKTISKCVGGVLDYNTVSVMSEKLSPIIQTASGSTSPRELENKDIKIGSNTITKSLTDTTTQVEDGVNKEIEIKIQSKESTKHVPQSQQHLNPEKIKITITKHPATTSSVVKDKFTAQDKYSSDSLIQHIHDLESPMIDKQSRCSEDPMENKLEREYRKIFTTKSKQSKKSNIDSRLPDNKSASILKRRFEALRRSLGKKEDSSKNSVFISKLSSRVNMSAASHRDVSINSDPPSLEARSYSQTKIYSPHAFPSIVEHDKAIPYSPQSIYERSISSKQTDRNALSWPKTDEDDSESQGVKGMFKLWGKKFNLEDDHYRSNTTPKSSYTSKKGVKKERPLKISSKINAEEKEKRKFFFFKKKNKEKPFKTKKGVTAGRCEVKDGLMIKIGNVTNELETQDKRLDEMSDIYEETMKSAWLQKYLSQGIESRNSVKIRWNNKTYTASSSTVFELMDNIYKDQGKVFRSKSEVTIESSYYKSYTRHHQVNFMQQNIEAWMIPQTIITDYTQNLPIEARPERREPSNENMEVTISDQKWLIDKSKAFSHKIEVVLLSKNFVRCNKKASSEYLRIDIPKGFFVNSSEASADSNNVGNKRGMYKQSQSSDEEVYKIVEYETGSDTKKERNTRKVDTGYHKHNNIKVTVSVKSNRDIEPRIVEKMIKSPPAHREVLIQGSNVCIPKRCDVIGVGIITRRDMHLSDSRKPILKIVDYPSEDDSEHDLKPQNKKCELAESYLQDYYRNCTSLGLDFFSWRFSDSRLRCCSETSKTSFLNQGDGTKSCPNIFDDYQTIVSSCDTSSRFIAPDYDPEPERAPCWYQKLKKRKPCDKPQVINIYDAKRMYPKDSIAVCKKRKLYAKSNKSKWGTGTPCCQTPIASMPSYECKSSGSPCSREIKPCWKPTETKPKKKSFEAKHVSLPNCEEINDLNEKLNDCCEPESILSVKGTPRASCGKKEAKINPIPSCHIPPTPCRSSCERMPKPPCRNSKVSCDELLKSKSCSPPCSPPISVSVICPPPGPCVPCQSPPTPPCKSTSPPPCKTPSPPCKTPSPPCKTPSPPCKKPSPPCKKSSIPFCKKPSPVPCKKPPPCKKPSPPVCKKPSPPVCKKPSPPVCKKPSPPVCIKPSPPPCKTPPCKKPSPPRCKKSRHSKVSSPTCSNTSSKTSSSSGSCNKPTGIKLNSPPISRKCSPKRPPCPHSHPPCPGTPPSCCVMSPPCPHAFPRCPFSPPSCPHSFLPCPPPCPYAVKCPPQTPQKCPSTPSTCPYSPPCYSPPPCKKPPCPPKPPTKTSRKKPPSCPTSCHKCPSCHKPISCHKLPPCTKLSSCPKSPPCQKPAPCPKSPCPYALACSHTPPCSVPPPCPDTPPRPYSPPCPRAPKKLCPGAPEPCCVRDPALCPSVPAPCKTKSGLKKILARIKSPSSPGSPSCKPPPCNPPPCKPPPPCKSSSLRKPICMSSHCCHQASPRPCSPICQKFSVASAVLSYSSLGQGREHEAPFRYSPISPCPGHCVTDEQTKSPNLEEKTSDHEGPNRYSPISPCPGHCVADEQKKSPNHEEKTSDYEAPFRYSPIHPCPGHCVADEQIKSPNLEEKTSDLTHKHSSCCNSMKTKQESSTQSLTSRICQKLQTPQMSCETIPPSPKRSTCKRSCPNHPDQTVQQPTCQKKIICPPSPPPPPPPCPPPPPPSIAPPKLREGPTKPPTRPQTPNKNKVTGVHLRMSPSKKQSNSVERVIWENQDNAFDFNSDDKITIRLKKQTPSTEEIREGLNIKVQDEDGMTLYERKDYRQRAPVYERTSPSLLGDLYRHSHVHRVAATLPAQTNSNKDCHKDVLEDGSDTSIANTIEIQFKLKVTQGDKTTEIKVANDKVDVEDSKKNKPLNKMPQDVFVLNNDGEHASDQPDGKNDVNIRIIIKNFKPKGSKKFTQHNDYVKEFAKQISTKFHSVSTAPEDTDRTFSIHRATVDLTSSIEKQSSRHENQGVKSQLLEQEPEKISQLATEESICRCVVEDRLSTIGDGDSPSRSSNNESQPSETHDEWEPEKDEREADTDIEKPETDIEKPETDLEKPESDTEKLDTDTERLSEPKHNTILFTDTDDPDTILEQDDEISKESEEKIVKPRTKEEKNKMLKNVFEKAHDTNNPKTRTKLMNVLKVVLTSDSSGPDLKAPNDSRNDLAKDVTYASLKPNYFRDTNSMNNYYKGNSIVAISDRDINQQVIYPTEENNSECTKSSYVTTDNDTTPPKQGCMCSTVAERLKMVSRMCNIRENCCCSQRKPKNIKSEETCCDLKKDFEYDYYDTNYKEAEYVDVQTQNSRYLSSKVTSANFSIHSQLKTNIIFPHLSIQQNVTTHSTKLRSKEESKRDMQQFPEPLSPPMKQMRKLNQKTILAISDEDKIVLLSDKPEKYSSEDRRNNTKGNLDKMIGDDNKTVRDAAHILQSYETKKAVLEIYTENSAPDKESRLVAKLPKFAYETENDVYDAIATNANTFKSVYKRNIVMMTINR